MPDKSEYHTFKPGDRFNALFVGYSNTYRVKRVFDAKVVYSDTDMSIEPVVETKSGLVFTTHVCGALLDFAGDYYTPCPATKTWLSYKLDKGEIATNPYALGEK